MVIVRMENEGLRSAPQAYAMALVWERAKRLFLPFDSREKDTTGYQMIVQLVDGKPTGKAHINKPDKSRDRELTLSNKGYYKVNLSTGECDCYHYEKNGYCKHSMAAKWWPATYHHELIPSKNGKYAFVRFTERKAK
jgi:hypothetical protein